MCPLLVCSRTDLARLGLQVCFAAAHTLATATAGADFIVVVVMSHNMMPFQCLAARNNRLLDQLKSKELICIGIPLCINYWTNWRAINAQQQHQPVVWAVRKSRRKQHHRLPATCPPSTSRHNMNRSHSTTQPKAKPWWVQLHQHHHTKMSENATLLGAKWDMHFSAKNAWLWGGLQNYVL